MKWSEREIAKALHAYVFKHRNLVVVPNCQWPGSECDLLVVRPDLRLIDVEIKISRADLKADARKDKWFDLPVRWPIGQERPRIPRAYPARIWKHYYAFPRSIWSDDLLEFIQPISGILMISERDIWPSMSVKRQAKANREAKPIDMADVIDIARLASARMWTAYGEVDEHRREQESQRAKLENVA